MDLWLRIFSSACLLDCCKQQKREFEKTVTSCMCVLCVQSIGVVFLYKVTLPITRLAAKHSAFSRLRNSV